MSKPRVTSRKIKLAVLAAMPYPTPQGSQVFIGSLVYALRAAGYEVSFHTYPITDGRLVNTTTAPESIANNTAAHLNKLANISGQVVEQISREVDYFGLPTLAGQLRKPIKEHTINGLNNLAELLSANLLRSGPSVAKVEQDLLLFKHTMEELASTHPDLLYVHNYEALAIGLPLAILLQCPVLYHAHNIMGAELPSYFKTFQAKLLAMVGGKALDFMPAMATQLLLFSQQQTSLLEGHLLSEEKINIIPPGLLAKEPLDLFWNTDRPKPNPELPEGPFFLYTGNCDQYQNLPLLVAAFEKAAPNIPHKLILCTSTPPTDLDLSNPRVIHLPMDNNAQLNLLIKHATALVVPREVSYGFPIKVLQALRAGLPVIGLKASLGQLLLDHEALLVGNSPAALSKAMVKIGKSPALRERLSQQSRLTFDQRFTLEKQIKQYDLVFKKTLQSYNKTV